MKDITIQSNLKALGGVGVPGSLDTKKAGIGRYTANLIKALLMHQNFKYYGITGPETEFEQLNSVNLDQEYHCSIGSTLIRTGILSIKLPKYIRLHHSLDNSSLFTFNKKIKKVSTIYDMAVFKYPEYFSKKQIVYTRHTFGEVTAWGKSPPGHRLRGVATF